MNSKKVLGGNLTGEAHVQWLVHLQTIRPNIYRYTVSFLFMIKFHVCFIKVYVLFIFQLRKKILGPTISHIYFCLLPIFSRVSFFTSFHFTFFFSYFYSIIFHVFLIFQLVPLLPTQSIFTWGGFLIYKKGWKKTAVPSQLLIE